jgi:hypothetical protein
VTAAGPWIRVDSGERPEDGAHVLLWYDGGCGANEPSAGEYWRADWISGNEFEVVITYFSHFARIIPPEPEPYAEPVLGED